MFPTLAPIFGQTEVRLRFEEGQDLRPHLIRNVKKETQLSTLSTRFSSTVECRTRKRESPGSNRPPTLFATVSKLVHFSSLHDAPVHSYV